MHGVPEHTHTHTQYSMHPSDNCRQELSRSVQSRGGMAGPWAPSDREESRRAGTLLGQLWWPDPPKDGGVHLPRLGPFIGLQGGEEPALEHPDTHKVTNTHARVCYLLQMETRWRPNARSRPLWTACSHCCQCSSGETGGVPTELCPKQAFYKIGRASCRERV